jgi:malate dehydrogenase (oxaloacetate-decarboxylating)
MVKTMNADPMIFAMANPTPEIMPEEAKEAGAVVVATGRSDFPNQINNVLAFPGLFRAVLDARIRIITDEIKITVAEAIAAVISEEELSAEYIIPDPFNPAIVPAIVKAIASL